MIHRKKFIITMFFSLTVNIYAQSIIPSEVESGIKQSGIGESGGFFIHGVEKEKFYDFIKYHWREMADNIEVLPSADAGPGFSFNSEKVARSASAMNFAAACEILPPEEYVEFLDKWTSLAEEGRIPFAAFERMGVDQKYCFLDVNWEHPKVKGILRRMIKLAPPNEESWLEMMTAIANGELADTYMENMSDDAPLPQTLPGIKLKKPWGSLIKRYERLTGKKADVPSRFDDMDIAGRVERRPLKDPQSTKGSSEVSRSSNWISFALVGGGFIAALFSAFKIIKKRRPAGLQ